MSAAVGATPNKDKIVDILQQLSNKYKSMPDKTFQLRAVITALSNLKKLNDEIISGKDAAKKVKGIGDGMKRRIDEILEKGELDELKGYSVSNTGDAKRAKKGEKGIIHVTGIGPVKAKKLRDEGYNTIDELNKAVASGSVKLTHHQQIGVKYYDDFLERIPRKEIVSIEQILRDTLKAVGGGNHGDYILEVCGSYRRGREDCGDVDVLMTYAGMKKVNSKFLTLFVHYLADSGFIVDHLTTNITTKYMGVCKLGKTGVARRIDIRSVPYHCFYPALIYFTGSKEFNIAIRRKALEKGFSLSEYGFKNNDDGKLMSFKSEKEIFSFLGMDFVEPKDR